MNKKKLIYAFGFFVIFVSLYYFGVKPLISNFSNKFEYYDDFEYFNEKFWYAGNMLNHLDSEDDIKLDKGILSLRKNNDSQDLYLISKPIKVIEKQIIKISRKTKISPGKKYFSGGFVLFQTNTNMKVPDFSQPHPFGSALFMIEYVSSPKGNTRRPGNNNFRLMASDWEENENYELIDPLFDKYFEEEIIYNSFDGKIDYIVNGKTYSLSTDVIKDDYVRLWMHAYGNSKNQRIDIEDLKISVSNIEDKSMK